MSIKGKAGKSKGKKPKKVVERKVEAGDNIGTEGEGVLLRSLKE